MYMNYLEDIQLDGCGGKLNSFILFIKKTIIMEKNLNPYRWIFTEWIWKMIIYFLVSLFGTILYAKETYVELGQTYLGAYIIMFFCLIVEFYIAYKAKNHYKQLVKNKDILSFTEWNKRKK